MSFSHLDPTTDEAAWQKAGLSQLPVLDGSVLDSAQSLIVVGAHPDDEALGCAAVIARAAQLGLDTQVVSYTHGEGSHPRSPTHSREQLAQRREAEFHTAMRLLNPRAAIECRDLPDGQLTHHQETLTQHLTGLMQSAPRPAILAAPFHRDGHTDHDTLGQLARRVAKNLGVTLVEYPIWYWHWADPENTTWDHWYRLPDPPELDRRALYGAYPSQVQPLSDAPGDEPIVGSEFLAHFHRGYDTLLVAEHHSYDAQDAATVFDQLHSVTADPWQLASSEYEVTKRHALLSALGSGYHHTLEIGCSIGTLSAGLAEHSGQVTAIDASPTAIETARRRYGDRTTIDFQCLTVPFDWPEAQYDLVVLSEVGYFMAPAQLEQTLQLIHRSTDDIFTVALCHVRGEIADWPADAVSVHEQCRHFWPNATVVTTAHTEHYLLEVWRIDKTAAAARGLGGSDAS